MSHTSGVIADASALADPTATATRCLDRARAHTTRHATAKQYDRVTFHVDRGSSAQAVCTPPARARLSQPQSLSR